MVEGSGPPAGGGDRTRAAGRLRRPSGRCSSTPTLRPPCVSKGGQGPGNSSISVLGHRFTQVSISRHWCGTAGGAASLPASRLRRRGSAPNQHRFVVCRGACQQACMCASAQACVRSGVKRFRLVCLRVCMSVCVGKLTRPCFPAVVRRPGPPSLACALMATARAANPLLKEPLRRAMQATQSLCTEEDDGAASSFCCARSLSAERRFALTPGLALSRVVARAQAGPSHARELACVRVLPRSGGLCAARAGRLRGLGARSRR